MRYILLLFSIFLSLGTSAQVQNPVTWKVTTQDLGQGHIKVIAQAKIDQGWYIYDNEDYKGGPNPTLLEIETSEGIVEIAKTKVSSPIKRNFDDIFAMEIGKCFKEATFEREVEVVTTSEVVLSGYIEWQSCSSTSCLAPSQQKFTITLPPTTSKESSSNLWLIILEAIAWGFAALLTPCVFPMVPMTVSYFLKHSGTKSRGKWHALGYGLSIVALYTIPIAAIIGTTYLVGGEVITADIFNFLATHWLPNILFFVIFVLFAASFLGAFELSMPSFLVAKSDSSSEKGGLGGIFFMALTLVLVSFSCTGPIVGSVIVKSTQGDIWEPIVTMLAFSTAFALPFVILALFPSLLRRVPKSGGWLGSVKVVLGFLELALALKFLSVADQTYHWNLLSRDLYIILWVVIFSLLGLYFLGKISFTHEEERPKLSVSRLFLAIITFSFVLYLLPGIVGAPLKALSGYLPPMHSQEFSLFMSQKGESDNGDRQQDKINSRYSSMLHLPHNLQGYYTLEEGLEASKRESKPLFLDFTGHGCVNCREMEAKVWSNVEALKILSESYIIVGLYTDDKMILDQKYWVTTPSGRVLKRMGEVNSWMQVEKFGVNAQPYYVICNSDGQQLLSPMGYDLNVDKFINFLKLGIERYSETQEK